VVSERVGHSTISIILDTYSHVLPGRQETAADKLDDLLKSVPGILKHPMCSKMVANPKTAASKSR
jgi:integrase